MKKIAANPNLALDQRRRIGPSQPSLENELCVAAQFGERLHAVNLTGAKANEQERLSRTETGEAEQQGYSEGRAALADSNKRNPPKPYSPIHLLSPAL